MIAIGWKAMVDFASVVAWLYTWCSGVCIGLIIADTSNMWYITEDNNARTNASTPLLLLLLCTVYISDYAGSSIASNCRVKHMSTLQCACLQLSHRDEKQLCCYPQLSYPCCSQHQNY